MEIYMSFLKEESEKIQTVLLHVFQISTSFQDSFIKAKHSIISLT